MEVTLNQQERQFVIKTGNSVSCMGFDVVYAQACELYLRLQKAVRKAKMATPGVMHLVRPRKSQVGSDAQYTLYRAMLAGYAKLNDNSTWFDGRTPKKVQQVLESARKSGAKIRIFYGDSDTGCDWLEELDTVGQVSRSSGSMKVPLLVAPGSYGGLAVLTHCIVRIIDVNSGAEIYRHPLYRQPELSINVAASFLQEEGYSHSVKKVCTDGELQTMASFNSYGQAAHWVAFLAGEVHACRD